MVTGLGKADLTAEIKVRNHTLVSGVTADQGGHDEGLDPHELLQSSLAACTMITVQMYAQRKKWDLQTVEVNVRIDKEVPGETHFTRSISFRGNLSEEQRERLFEIANKCPIHRLLLSKIEIESQLMAVE